MSQVPAKVLAKMAAKKNTSSVVSKMVSNKAWALTWGWAMAGMPSAMKKFEIVNKWFKWGWGKTRGKWAGK